jgi:hypothetical protein
MEYRLEVGHRGSDSSTFTSHNVGSAQPEESWTGIRSLPPDVYEQTKATRNHDVS